MKRVLTIKAKAGQVTAKNVYTDNGQLVIKQGTVLDKEIIDRLKYYAIFDFFIKDEDLVSYEQDDLERMIFAEQREENPEEDDAYYNRLHQTKRFKEFENMFHESVQKVQAYINDIVLKNCPINVDEMLNDVRKITSEFQPNVSVFDMIHCIEGYDDMTYVHSVNVALISRIIAMWMNLSKEDVDAITLGGLLHDIGKVMIPNEIITKPARLTVTEYAIVQTHPIHGFNILRNQRIDERVKQCALQHHERCDGKGYPYNKTYKEIEPLARIVSIADVYDAMTSNRVYRAGMCPFDVIELFEGNIDAYDPEVLLTVLEKIANSYINNKVVLSDDTEGKIIMINKNRLSRPVVRVGLDYIDLSKLKDIKIVSLK